MQMKSGCPDPTTDRPNGRDDLIFRQLDEEWVLYDSTGEKLHVLNRTAAVVWLHCSGEDSVDEIVDAVADAFDDEAPREVVESDVKRTIAEFREKGLLK